MVYPQDADKTTTTRNTMNDEAIKQMFAGAEQLPTLRGTLQQPSAAVWSGEWAMSEYEFYNGLKGQFEYKRTKKQVPMLAHKMENPEGVPADMYVNGYFTYQEGPRKSKINESNILLRFDDPNEEGVSRVTGYGVNANGPFHMLGLYVLETHELRVERAYENNLDPSAAASAAVVAPDPAAVQQPFDEPALPPAVRPRRSKVGLSAEQQKLRDYIVLMDKLKREDRSMLFLAPVDTVQWPDYVDIVQNPMDFGTIHNKLLQGEYSTIAQAQDDILLVFRNAQTYNAAGTFVFEEAKRLHLLFKREHDKQHKLWMKDDVLVVAEEQDKRISGGSKRHSENDDDYLSEFEAPSSATHATMVSKSGRKSRPPAKLKKTSPVKAAAATSPTAVDPVAAAAAAVKAAAMEEEIRMLKDRLNKYESTDATQQQRTKATTAKKPRVVATTGGDHSAVVEPSPRRSAVSRDDLPLTYQEQRVLAQQIFKLPTVKQAQLVKMLQDVSWHGEGNIAEFNLAKQPVNVQRAISKYVKDSATAFT